VNVELQTAECQPLLEYSLAECDRVYHNNIRKVVTCKGQSNLSDLAAKLVRMRFVMQDCKLSAFQFPESST